MVLNLRHAAAIFADEELGVIMMMIRIRARDEGVQPLDPVDEFILQQKVQRAVDGGRHSGFADGLELVQQLISRQRRMRFQDQLQNIPAQRGELRAVARAGQSRRVEPGGDVVTWRVSIMRHGSNVGDP